MKEKQDWTVLKNMHKAKIEAVKYIKSYLTLLLNYNL